MTDLELLRRLIDEPTTTTYADVELTDRLNAVDGDKNLVAHQVWVEKLAALSSFVNTSEGGSSRSMAQAFDHAKAMVELYGSLVAGAGRPKIHRLVRP